MSDTEVDTRFMEVIAKQTKDTMPDMVHKPPHYKLPGLDVEVLDVRSALLKTVPPGVPYEAVTCWSESITYLMRMWGKNGLEDAQKAKFYLDRMLSIYGNGASKNDDTN